MRIPAAALLALSIGYAVPAPAQFGGVLGRAKQKMEETRQKAKPVTDRAEKAAAIRPWTEEEEQQIGQATAAKMVAMFGVVDDPAVVRYVNLVGATVARQAPRKMPYRFAVLDTEIVGAFALPGGYVFLTKGALLRMENEAQLAGALGHEVVHIAERHLETEIRSKRGSAWAIQEAQAQQLPLDQSIRQRADAFLNDLFNMRLSQDKEDAADRDGALMASRAGYTPRGLLTFLERLAQVNQSEENKRLFGQLLSTHPSFDSRIQVLQQTVAAAGDRGELLEARFRGVIPR